MSRWRKKKAPLRVVSEPQKRVCVATPCGESLHTGYTSSLVSMLMRTLGSEFPQNLGELMVQLYSCSVLPFSRQKLVSDAIEQGFTHLLFIDSDMDFPNDLLLRWIQRDEPILAANCVSRRPPYFCTAQSSPGVEVPTTQHSSGIEKVNRAGFGVIWFDLSIFQRIPEPWFEFVWVPEAKVFTGEDYSFCKKATQAGFPIHIDHDVSKEVKHMGFFGYSPLQKAAMDLRRAELVA